MLDGCRRSEYRVGNLDDKVYEFCRDFKKIRAALEKDEKAIQQSYTNCENELRKAGIQNNATTAKVNGESTIYSAVYGTVVTEDNGGVVINKSSDTGASGGANVSAKAGGNVVNTTNSKNTVAANVKDNTYNANKDQQLTDQQKANLNKAGSEKDKDDNVTNLTKAMNVYQSTAGTMFSAKLTAIERIRKNYMKILEAHVKYYVGNEGAAPNQAQAQATDQSKVQKKGQQQQTKQTPAKTETTPETGAGKLDNQTLADAAAGNPVKQ